MVHLVRPGRDARVLPIEEVPVTVEAGDDFGLRELSLHYSVNGGPEKVVPLLKDKTAKQADGTVLLSLEDYKLVPGDVIALYASANDARNSTKTDMFFIETRARTSASTRSRSRWAAAGGRGQRTRRPAAGPDFPAAEGDHRGHLEPTSGQAGG